MLATELFSISQGSGVLRGPDQCHWCSGCCERIWPHDDHQQVMVGRRNPWKARCPGANYLCHGDWLWRRKSVTAFFLDGSYKDRQCALNHSWWITDEDAKALGSAGSNTRKMLYPLLLQPPNRFCVTLLADNVPNMLHLAHANDVAEIKADTPLTFTLGNVAMEYCIYDLGTALRDKNAARSPGVSALMQFCGPWELPESPKRGRGRPTTEHHEAIEVTKAVTLSGQVPVRSGV